MAKLLGSLALAVLIGCGADGDPLRPTAGINFGIGSGGVTTSAQIGAQNSNVSIGVGLN